MDQTEQAGVFSSLLVGVPMRARGSRRVRHLLDTKKPGLLSLLITHKSVVVAYLVC